MSITDRKRADIRLLCVDDISDPPGSWSYLGSEHAQRLADDIDSVAYWYQGVSHAPFPELPALERRWPR